MPYNQLMRTVIETEDFQRAALSVWNEGERDEFINWIAANPEAGDLIQHTGGLRKVRWTRAGMGKRGGARVVYYDASQDQTIWLLIAYSKAKFDNLPLSFLLKLKEVIEHG